MSKSNVHVGFNRVSTMWYWHMWNLLKNLLFLCCITYHSMVLCQFCLCVPNSFTQLIKCKVLLLKEHIGNMHENLKNEISNKVCGSYLVNLLNLAPINKRFMARLVHSKESTPRKHVLQWDGTSCSIYIYTPLTYIKRINTFCEDLCICSNRKRIFTSPQPYEPWIIDTCHLENLQT